MGFNMIITRFSFTIAFTEIFSQIRPHFPPPLLPLHDHQCPEEQPVSLVTQDHRTAGSHRFQHSILSPYPQPPHRPSFMKRPSRWSILSTIQTAQGRGDIASCRRPRSRSVMCQLNASSLLSVTSLILSPSRMRTGSTPWLLVLCPHGIRDGRAPSRSFRIDC